MGLSYYELPEVIVHEVNHMICYENDIDTLLFGDELISETGAVLSEHIYRGRRVSRSLIRSTLRAKLNGR